MTASIVRMPGTLESPDDLLAAAMGTLDSCIILGRDHEGEETFAVSAMDLSDFVYLLERAKFAYLLALATPDE